MENRREVPEAAVFDILLFLPVVSLLRFKSVCKTWCSMIESSTFVTRHRYHNREKNNVVCAKGREIYLFSGNSHEMMGLKLNVLSRPWEHGKKDFRMKMVNSCDGIVCVVHDMVKGARLVSLWNPATKQVRQLPEPTHLRPLGSKVNVFALGFDRKTRDYKIVRIFLGHRPYGVIQERCRSSVVEVYSKRSNAWQTIHNGKDFPVTWIEDCCNVACNDEICVWIGTAPSSRGPEYKGHLRTFFYFDLGNEVYGIVPAPDTLLNPRATANALAFVGEKFSLVKCHRGHYTGPSGRVTSYKDGDTRFPISSPPVSQFPPSTYVYEIWVMDEFGKKESWNKVYRVEEPLLPMESIDMISSPLTNGRFILRSKRDRSSKEVGLCLLDLVTLQEFLLIALDDDDDMFRLRWKVINYTESLVSVNGVD